MPTGNAEAAGGATCGEAGRRVWQHWECRMRCHHGSTCACVPQAKLLAGQVADALATEPISGSREGHQKRQRKTEMGEKVSESWSRSSAHNYDKPVPNLYDI